jgi:hypothetical protein
VGLEGWPVLQPAYLSLAAAAAVGGDSDIAAALLLSFPDMAAALGEGPTRTLLVPVIMELLHSQLVGLLQQLLLPCCCCRTTARGGGGGIVGLTKQ